MELDIDNPFPTVGERIANLERQIGEQRKEFRFFYFMLAIYSITIFFLSLTVYEIRTDDIRREAKVSQYGGQGGNNTDGSGYDFSHSGK